MEEKKEPRKLSMTSTKQEMLKAYNTLVKELEAKQESELKPEKKIEEKKSREAIQVSLPMRSSELQTISPDSGERPLNNAPSVSFPRSCVIPTQAGIQRFLKRMDSLFHGNDKLPGLERNSKVLYGLGAE